jgi:TRAP-type C4-dicarboxylate transport system permease small subunit
MLQILKKIDRAWAGLLWLLMAIASVYIGLIMVAIIYITTFRFFGAAYNVYTTSFIEYGFVYIMFLGSPWMVRNRGHVFIEMLTAAGSPRVRDILSRLIAFAAAAVCLIWAWYTWIIFLERFEDTMLFDELRAQLDIRLWVSTIAFPFGFLLMGIEFARFIFTAETMHIGLAGVASERVELEETKRSLMGDV